LEGELIFIFSDKSLSQLEVRRTECSMGCQRSSDGQ
jgi:hypothetical protein